MTKVTNTSVIIPSNHSHHDLLKVITAICSQSVKPGEIIIVDSSAEGGACPINILDACLFHGINLIYEHHIGTFPGKARNIGLHIAKSEFIAFIDVQTIPQKLWLEASLEMISKDNVAGVWGGTCFSAETCFEKLIRDGFFGVLPRKTLPGSIFKRDVFAKAGHFIDWVRAGEDTDWMLRLELLKIPVAPISVALIDYVGLMGINLKTILRKWHRNYSASHELPHLFPQKLFLWMILYPLIVFVGFNWNYLIANWHEDSPLYIAHITKMAAVFPILTYVITRGVILPLRRGVRIFDIFPLRFILISTVCFVADAVKAFVFTKPRWKRY
jgi:cellulose synthase/poly-beta-1,6-N-acetylglucosamine synthase-like glycosyltransferase